MRDRVRFHPDESVDLAVARALRRHGVDVATTPETGLRTASDKRQLEFAVRSLILMYEVLAPEEIRGHVEFL